MFICPAVSHRSYGASCQTENAFQSSKTDNCSCFSPRLLSFMSRSCLCIQAWNTKLIFFFLTSHTDPCQISGGCCFDVQMCIVLFSIWLFFTISTHPTFPLQMVMGKTLKQLLLVTSFIAQFGRHLVIMPRSIT